MTVESIEGATGPKLEATDKLEVIMIAECGTYGGETWFEWDGQRFPSYELALDAARAKGRSLEEDLQEALSVRYVDFARVAVLSSGRWGVFTGTGRGEGMEICQTPAQLVDAIRRAQEAGSASWLKTLALEAEERERAKAAPPVQQAKANASALGL